MPVRAVSDAVPAAQQAYEVRRAMAIERLQSTYDAAAASAAQAAAEEAERRRQEAALKEVERLSRSMPGARPGGSSRGDRPEYNPLTGQGGGDGGGFSGSSRRCFKGG